MYTMSFSAPTLAELAGVIQTWANSDKSIEIESIDYFQTYDPLPFNPNVREVVHCATVSYFTRIWKL